MKKLLYLLPILFVQICLASTPGITTGDVGFEKVSTGTNNRRSWGDIQNQDWDIAAATISKQNSQIANFGVATGTLANAVAKDTTTLNSNKVNNAAGVITSTMTNGSLVQAGANNGGVVTSTMANGSLVQAGSNNSGIITSTMANGSLIQAGAGNAGVITSTMSDGSLIKAGSGNLSVISGSMTKLDGSTFTFGSITIQSSFTITGGSIGVNRDGTYNLVFTTPPVLDQYLHVGQVNGSNIVIMGAGVGASGGGGGGGGDNFGSHIATTDVRVGTPTALAVVTISTIGGSGRCLLIISTNDTPLFQVCGGSVTSFITFVGTASPAWLDVSGSTQTKSGGIIIGGDTNILGKQIIFGTPSTQTKNPAGRIFVAMGTSSSGDGGGIAIDAGAGNASSARGGNIILRGGGCTNCQSFNATPDGGGEVHIWTTRVNGDVGTAAPFVRVTGYNFTIGSDSPPLNGVLVISTGSGSLANGTPVNVSLLYISTGTLNTKTSPIFDVRITSAIFGPSINKITAADASFGLGTSSPIAPLDVRSKVFSSSYTAVWSTRPANVQDNYAIAITTGQHFSYGGSSPAVTSCGTTPNGALIGGTDQAGTIQIGGGAVTSCLLTFQTTFSNIPANPSCTLSDNSGTITPFISALTNVSLTIGLSAALGGGLIYYHCDGVRD